MSPNSVERKLDATVLPVLISATTFWLSQTVADPDLWGHVAFGEHFWRHGFSRGDPYSYLTTNTPWTDHEWLSEVVLYLAYAVMGAAGLVMLKTGALVLIVTTVYLHVRSRGGQALPAAIVAALCALALIPGVLVVRTHIFTYVLFLVVLVVLADAGRRPRLLWTLPPFFAVWANLHPGFMAGLGVVLTWVAVQMLGEGRGRRAHLVAVAVGSAVATLATPFGLELWRFLFHAATFVRPDISEWHPVRLMSPYGVAYLTLALAAIVGIVFSRRPRSAASVAILVGAMLAPLSAARHGPLFGLAVGILAGDHITDAWQRARDRWRLSPVRASRWAMVASLAAASVLLVASVGHFRCIPLDPTRTVKYPVRAVALLKQSGIAANMVVHFDWGLYAIWHLYPKVKVSVDGRRETGYSDAVYRENLALTFGVGDWAAILRRPETDLALVSKEAPGFNLMSSSDGWVVVHEDSFSGLFAREGREILTSLRRTPVPDVPPDGRGTCFP